MPRKTPREKLHIKRPPEIAQMTSERQLKQFGPGTMLIPTPLQIDRLIREIPEGEVWTVEELRDKLARREGATVTCPLCAGIFWKIAAEAAEQDRQEGVEPITPYWRVVKAGGKLNPKLPGGAEAHASKLAAEGHAIRNGKLVRA